MIQRIVRLHFKSGKAEEFLNEILPQQKHFTRNFEGCSHLEIWRDINNGDIVLTYSLWNSETDLNNYRHSEMFRNFWRKSKDLFESKAIAHSVNLEEVVYK